MRIKELCIVRYGPLASTGRVFLGDFNLLYGRNEDGKTLTIDAVVKILFGKYTRDFEEIERLEETPEGYVILENDAGKEFKFPKKGDVTKVVDLTPAECSNIFIVRNSKLSIARDIAREGDFYTTVTDRLTGLRTEELSRIKTTLLEIGKITKTGVFRDIKDEKLKTGIESATSLLKEIDTLSSELEQKGYDQFEQKFVLQAEAIEELKHTIQSLEDARKGEKYKTGRGALDEIKQASAELKNLEMCSEEDRELWRDCERKMGEYRQEYERYSNDVEKNEQALKSLRQEAEALEREFLVLDKRKEKLDNEIKPELNDYEKKSAKLSRQAAESKWFTLAGIVSFLLFGVSLLGVIFNPSVLLYIFLVLFLVSGLVSAVVLFQFVRNKSLLAEAFKKITLELSKVELDAETIEEILANIQKFHEKYANISEKRKQVMGKEERSTEKNRELLHQTIPHIEQQMKVSEEKVHELKLKSGEASIEAYTEKLRLKSSLEKAIAEQARVLESHFGQRSATLEENISHWNNEIDSLYDYRDKANTMNYVGVHVAQLEKRKQDLERELREIEQSLHELSESMESTRKKMEKVGQQANSVVRLEEPVRCSSLLDLKKLKGTLEAFVAAHERMKENVLKATELFEAIEAEEKEKVSMLFGKDSSTSKYFREITDGLYTEVHFDQEAGRIEVERQDARVLDAAKLSGGAYDQLYFSIRLALGEKLLKGNKGFFIMDDPFIKADPRRLKKQIELLQKVSAAGWQVIYFSAKGEIKELLEPDIKKELVKYVEVGGLALQNR